MRTSSIFRNSLPAIGMVVVFTLTSAHYAASQSPGKIAADLRERYESLESMSARFVHTMTSDFLDTEERFSGTLVFVGKKYRVETSTQTIVTDGAVTWVHNLNENQVLVNDYVDDESTFSLTELLQAFDQEYDAISVESTSVRSARIDPEDSEDVPHTILELAPRDELADYRSVRLWIRSRDHLVTRLRVVDLNDAVLEFELSDIVFNPPVPESTFTFDVPEGVEIVDLRN